MQVVTIAAGKGGLSEINQANSVFLYDGYLIVSCLEFESSQTAAESRFSLHVFMH